jgi:hypothetical protein
MKVNPTNQQNQNSREMYLQRVVVGAFTMRCSFLMTACDCAISLAFESDFLSFERAVLWYFEKV